MRILGVTMFGGYPLTMVRRGGLTRVEARRDQVGDRDQPRAPGALLGVGE
jgi:hypothetical protein